MKQMQQIKGFSYQQAAHVNPVNSVKELEDHQIKSQSLLQKCFKSLIKEKLSGCLINIQRRKRDLEERSKSYENSHPKEQSNNYQGINGYLNSSIKKRQIRINPELFMPNIYSQNNSVKNSRNSHNQSTLVSSMNSALANNARLSKFSQKNRYRLINQTSPNLEKTKQQNIGLLRKRIQSSFISAIENIQNQNQTEQYNENRREIYNMDSLKGSNTQINTSPKNIGSRLASVANSQVKFPHLKTKNKINNLNSSTNSVVTNTPNNLTTNGNINSASTSSIIKTILKKSADYNINQQFWKYLTNQTDLFQQQKRRKTSTCLNDVNLVSSQPISKQVKSSLFKPNIPSASRQNFYKYISLLPKSFIRLIQFVISFFDVKIPNQLSALYYSNLLQQLRSINSRAWSVIAFVFWDLNRDGVINSRDVFNIFRQFNNFDDQVLEMQKLSRQGRNRRKTRIKQREGDKQKQKQRQPEIKQQKKASSAIKDKKKKQNTINKQIMSSMEQIETALKKYKPESEKQRQKRLQQLQSLGQLDNSVNDQISHRLLVLKLQKMQEALKKFRAELQRLNNKLSRQIPQQLYEQSKQGEQLTVSYLQQVILTQPIIKYQQILPLFSAGDQKNKGLQNKLELFPKELSVKCSSSYKQCFISTQHNEQTRLLRENIENYKHILRKKRERKNKQLQGKVSDHLILLNQINYIKVAESGMGLIIRDILFCLLGYEDQ